MANAGSQTHKKKRIMRTFKMDEISGVDNPAQAGARVVLIKNDDNHSEEIPGSEGQEKLGKQAALTTETRGHTHLLRLDNYQGMPIAEGETSRQADHSHPWIIDAEGKMHVGAVNGHTHEIEALGKLSEEGTLEPSEDDSSSSEETVNKKEPNDMADDNTKIEEELKVLKADLAKSNAINGLSADHRVAYDALAKAEDQDAFLAKSVTERQADLDAAAASNKVVFKSATTGQEFTAQDDPRMIEMAKNADADRAEIAALRKASEESALAKRAEDISGLPGDAATHIALLKAAESITDEKQRDAAVAALKSQSADLQKMSQTVGYQGTGSTVHKSGESQSSDAELDTMAKAYAKENNVSDAMAYDAVIQTPKGRELYAQSLN